MPAFATRISTGPCPASASLRAIASPIPRFPPVTRADRLICANTSSLRSAAPDPGERTRAAARATAWDRERCRQPGQLGVLEAEADLEPDLEMRDVAVHDLTADLGDLEPVQVPQGLPGTVQRAADGRLDSLRR